MIKHIICLGRIKKITELWFGTNFPKKMDIPSVEEYGFSCPFYKHKDGGGY